MFSSYAKKIQLEAAREVTGATRSTLQNLYREAEWMALADRRLYQKLALMYKI